MAKKKSQKIMSEPIYVQAHMMSKSDLEKEIATLDKKGVLLDRREFRRLRTLKIELMHRISKMPRSIKHLIVQGGVCGSTKK